MNQEEQDKIYQLIQTEDINNWELAYQLSVGLIGENDSNILFKKLLAKIYQHAEDLYKAKYNHKMIYDMTCTNLMYKIRQFKQTKNMNN